jgi:hypothetical protein
VISQLLEIAPDIAGIIALLLPIVIGCIFFLIIPVMRDGSGSALRRYVSYLIKPPRLGSTEDGTQSRTSLGRDIKVKLFFVYLGIALFLISFTMSEFYEVIFDLIMPVTQGSTGEIRTVTSIVFLSPFTAGWVGALPWYGYLPAPAGLGTYHDPWGWIFATSAYTDNPNFLGTMVTVLVMFSFIVGILFLIPLAFKRIRQSILPSLFFFTSGMMIFTKAAIGGLGHALALTFGAQLRVGIMIITGTMIPDLNEVIAIGFLIVFALYIFFAFMGRELWKVHYDDIRSRRWFLVYFTLIYWLGLTVTILVV